MTKSENFNNTQHASPANQLSRETAMTSPYRYHVFSGHELAQHTQVIADVKTMLLTQSADRFHARFPKFKYHEEPQGTDPDKVSRRSQRYLQAKTTFVDTVLSELASAASEHIVIVYDIAGRLAVLADSHRDAHEPKETNLNIIRAQESTSLESGPSLTDFAITKLFAVSLNDPETEHVTASVHRNNPRSRRVMFLQLEYWESQGYRVSMQDGKNTNKDSDKYSLTQLKHWREYRVTKPNN